MAVGSSTVRRDRVATTTMALLAIVACGAGCASKVSAPAAPKPPVAGSPAPAIDTTAEALRHELQAARAESARLQEQLKAAQQETAVAQEQREAMRWDMKRVLDDVLAAKASGSSGSGVQNRALAISRIAEVRVQLQNVAKPQEPEGAARLHSAAELLTQADQTLEQGNYGGASYLADRAGDLVQQARTVAQVAARQNEEGTRLIPIVPPRTLEVTVAANLREGPNATRPRVAGAKPGAQLVAVARVGEWFKVETEAGSMAWIHRGTVR